MSRPLLPLSVLLVVAGCASSGDAAGGDAIAVAPSAPAETAGPTCTKPHVGRYTVDVTPKTSCAWWDSTRDHADMNILEDAVRYPNSDDLCGDVQWNGCTLEDECGPLKFSAGSQGWYGKGSLSIAFTDDEHFAGTVTYDIGMACKMILEIQGERLPLGG